MDAMQGRLRFLRQLSVPLSAFPAGCTDTETRSKCRERPG
jgi:hypothetical protein